MLKDITQVCNTSLGKVTECSIGLVSIGEGKFPEKTKSKSCKWMRWIRDVLTMGAVRARGCKALPVGAFVEGELHMSWIQFFPSPFMPFILYSLLLFLQEAIQGTLPWRGDQWWQCYPQVFSQK
jgi:hypothetical protein